MPNLRDQRGALGARSPLDDLVYVWKLRGQTAPLLLNSYADPSLAANRGILQERRRHRVSIIEGWMAARQSRLARGLTLAR